MAITDPEAIKFVNETIRPLSESARALYYSCLNAKEKAVNGGIMAEIPDGPEVVEDGRESSGVSRLNGQDVGVLVSFFSSYISAYEAAGQSKMQKPCVRQFKVA